MSRDYEPLSRTRLIFQFANAFAITITFARFRRRSEESTSVPYGANFYFSNPNICCIIVTAEKTEFIFYLVVVSCCGTGRRVAQQQAVYVHYNTEGVYEPALVPLPHVQDG